MATTERFAGASHEPALQVVSKRDATNSAQCARLLALFPPKD
ncbi:hypothetical protein [Streptomyces sp. A5-4]